jgi:mannose/fructose/N-acetylgalactosamine-specific phosphotransferase system component IID
MVFMTVSIKFEDSKDMLLSIKVINNIKVGSLTPLLGIGAQVALQFGSNGLIKRFLLGFRG